MEFFSLGKIMDVLSWILNFFPSLKILQQEMKDPLTIPISKVVMRHRKSEALGGNGKSPNNNLKV